MPEPLLSLRHLYKTYQMGEVAVHALSDVSLDIYPGEFIVILGPSVSGKSTLLNIIGGMDTASAGEIVFSGSRLDGASDRELTLFRRHKVGFVFQFYNLMALLTARENVELASEISEDPLDVDETLEALGLGERKTHFPSQLSGGEQQRVAIARAIAKKPELILCDEPTGALDFATGVSILEVLRDINRTHGKTVIVITHNTPIAQMADRVITIRSGQIVSVETNAQPLDPEAIKW